MVRMLPDQGMLGINKSTVCLIVISSFMAAISVCAEDTVREHLETIERIVIPSDGAPVNLTVAEAIQAEFAPESKIVRSDGGESFNGRNTILVGISDEAPIAQQNAKPDASEWMCFQVPESGPIQLVSSKEHLLYALFCRVRDDWCELGVSDFSEGRVEEPAFPVIIGEDGCYGFWRRFSKGYDPEAAIRETARMGVSHVIVNSLPQPFAMEDGPEGEIYYRFYQYLPDLDQFVETELNKGTYPPEYLQANLDFLREQTELAVKYGLTPGMHVANPRSAPETLLAKYPYLRGARVDHPFRSYRPRYTLTLAHPIVRWHYASLIKGLLQEIPEIGFLTTLINDSGSGFEYTESLYPGRNGGQYLVREWRPDDVIAKKAAGLVIQYYQLLRDAAREINPEFRIHMGLNNIKEEKQIIYDGLGDGLDRLVRTQRMDIQEDNERNRRLEERNSYRIGYAAAEGNPYIMGLPAPKLTHEALKLERSAGTSRLEIEYDPISISPYDVNREVLRAFQLQKKLDLNEFLSQTSKRLVGTKYSAELVRIWGLSDKAVRQAPVLPLYGGLGFAWYRFWVRPFVPDIEAIPPAERAYYEDYMLTTFNNPHNVDFQADALWDIHSTAESEEFVERFDRDTLPVIEQALLETEKVLDALSDDQSSKAVFEDLEIRLRAYQCYSLTLRNILAWIAGVHGYLETESESKRVEYLNLTREMVQSELANTRNLLSLWKSSKTVFMPIHKKGEWMHDYGPNFGELLKKKIQLMEQYGDRMPRIDPDYMWRMPDPAEVENAPELEMSEYIGY